MPTTKTRAELVERALQRLGEVGAGEAPSAEDSALCDGMFEPVMENLQARGIFAVGDENELPAAVFEWLSVCLADAVAIDFGKSPDMAQRKAAEREIRAVQESQPSYETLRVKYF